MTGSLDYDKLTDPVTDIIETTKALLLNAFGSMMGDQREGINRIYANAGGLYTLFMDIITSLGVEKLYTRSYLLDKFNDLITPVQSRCKVLLDGVDGPLNEEQVVAVEYIQDTAKNLRLNFDNLWIYSRLINQQVRPQKLPVSVSKLLDPAYLPVTEKPVELELRYADGLPLVNADATLLKFCIFQLVLNAVRFTRDGSITLRAFTTDNMLKIRVVDTGIGIGQEHQEDVLLPFFQVEAMSDGLGLGLYIAQALVELHNGKLELDSILDDGTTVTLSLPVFTGDSID